MKNVTVVRLSRFYCRLIRRTGLEIITTFRIFLALNQFLPLLKRLRTCKNTNFQNISLCWSNWIKICKGTHNLNNRSICLYEQIFKKCVCKISNNMCAKLFRAPYRLAFFIQWLIIVVLRWASWLLSCYNYIVLCTSSLVNTNNTIKTDNNFNSDL